MVDHFVEREAEDVESNVLIQPIPLSLLEQHIFHTRLTSPSPFPNDHYFRLTFHTSYTLSPHTLSDA